MTIYLDVLLLSNFWADYVMLRTAAAVAHIRLPRYRAAAGAGVGAVSAMMILLPELHPALCLLARVVTALCMTGTAFGIRKPSQLLRRTAFLFGMSLLFCGTVYALSILRLPFGFCLHNAVPYADFSLLTLLIGTTAAAAAAAVCERRCSLTPSGSYRLHLRIHGTDFSIPALADTGNLLRDVYTGKPVVICTEQVLRSWLATYPDAASAAAECRSFRLLPVNTVTGTCVLPAFSPDLAAVRREGTGSEIPLDIMVAISDQPGGTAVVPACCIRLS